MFSFFSRMGGSSSKISAQDRAILDLKNQRDKLHQYQKRITILTSREHEVARECLRNGQKDKALLALRKKKYQESLLSKTDQQLAQLEALTSDVEFALVQKDVLFGLQQGTAVLKAIHKEMGGLEKVEMIMGESEEAHAYQREIEQALGGRMTNQEEDEVEDEFERLEREMGIVASLPDAPNVIKEEMPDAPQEIPDAPQESPAERQKRRIRERAARAQASEPLAA